MNLGPLSEWAIAAATITGLLVTAGQVREAVKNDMRQIAAVLSDPTFHTDLDDLRKVFGWGDWADLRERHRLWIEWEKLSKPERGRRLTPLNQLETLSLISQSGASKKQANKLWGSTAIAIWDEAEPFIVAYRKKRPRPTAYLEFERLVDYFRGKRGGGATVMSTKRKIFYGIGSVLVIAGVVVAMLGEFRTLYVGGGLLLGGVGGMLLEWAVDEKPRAKWLFPVAVALLIGGTVEKSGSLAKAPVEFYVATAQLIPLLLIALVVQVPELRRQPESGPSSVMVPSILLLIAGEASALIALAQPGPAPLASKGAVGLIAAAVAGGFAAILVGAWPSSKDPGAQSAAEDS